MDQLLQKLMVSKAIMDKSDRINRGNAQPPINVNPISVDGFDVPQAKYNIPSDILQESQNNVIKQNPERPLKTPTVDAIKNSKLPDEIKRLMIEHPIVQPQMQSSTTLSDELIEKASRLMKENSNNYTPESAKTKKQIPQSSNIDYEIIRNMIKEVVEETLKENGMIAESSEKTNEIFSFKVGKHVFEGKVTKIKKLQ